jgi:hypothetical protein
MPGVEVWSNPQQESRGISVCYIEQSKIVDVTASLNHGEADDP